MKRTPRPTKYDHLQAAYERAQEHALIALVQEEASHAAE